MDWYSFEFDVKVRVVATNEHDIEQDIRDILTSNDYDIESIQCVSAEIDD